MNTLVSGLAAKTLSSNGVVHSAACTFHQPRHFLKSILRSIVFKNHKSVTVFRIRFVNCQITGWTRVPSGRPAVSCELLPYTS